VEAGVPLAEVHARSNDGADRAVEDVLAAYALGPDRPPERPIVLDVIA
jgi:thymidine phosphorylase